MLIKLGNIIEIFIIFLLCVKAICYDVLDLYNSVHQTWQEVELWVISTMLLFVVANVCIKLWRIKDED